ncbi:MAG: hypothetical protein HYY50_00900 [Candidatus Kerfeldbacteria bacterium]|nr:hypothetical protein [Candidatus Kerfeldbacteria bacterium]
MIVGWVLIVVGILNFFFESIKLLPAHAVFHIVAGFLGVALPKMHKGYTMWVGIVGVLLAVVGLFTKDLFGIINLPIWITIVHAVLGILGLIVWAGAKGGMKSAPAAPTMPNMPPSGGSMGGPMGGQPGGQM